jgi:hypothetical protein
MASKPIYQFYAELEDYKPKIWRRFQVANNITMARLGYIIMTMFEMQASHLFCFDVPIAENLERDLIKQHDIEFIKRVMANIGYKENGNWHIELLNEDYEDYRSNNDIKVTDAADSILKYVVSTPKDKMMFNYDYGDNWLISLVLEKVIIDEELPGKELPRVLEGTGYGIIEDCGGTSGLEALTKAFKKKSGKQYKELSEWLGRDDLDMAAFDVDDINFRLKKVPRIYADAYEYGLEPTKRSLDLLDRKYLKKKK